MNKIIIGPCAKGKTKGKVLPSILEHKGKIIFISAKDEVQYLNIDSLFVKREVFDNTGSMEKECIMDCLDQNTNVFIECKTPRECHVIGRILSDTRVLDNENILLIIDEGLHILGNIEWDMIDVLSNKKVDTLLTFQSEKYLEELGYLTEKGPEAPLRQWNIEYV